MSEEIISRIFRLGETSKIEEETGLLKQIRTFDHEVISFVLGSVGEKLKQLAKVVDLCHPELKKMHRGELVHGNNTFARLTLDMLNLVKFGTDRNVLPSILNDLAKIVKKHECFSEFEWSIDSPFLNQQNIRLLPKREDRDHIRKHKRKQTIGLGWLYGGGITCWDTTPTHFKQYYRFANQYELAMEEATAKSAHMLKHGLPDMAARIVEDVKQLKESAEKDLYYGFNKISVQTAAVILARMGKYEFSEKLGNSPAVYVEKGHFPGYDVFVDHVYGESSSHYNKFTFSPRIYPLHQVTDKPTANMSMIIDHLESFPDVGNKSIFDHYRVLVPGFDYPLKSDSGTFTFVKPDGKEVSFPTRDDAQTALDFTLLENGLIKGVLVGEVSGEHYFITFWEPHD